MQDFLSVPVVLDNGEVIDVTQPIDGLTALAVSSLTKELKLLDASNEVLTVLVEDLGDALEDDYNYALTEPIENNMLGQKALNLSYYAEDEVERVLLALAGTALCNLYQHKMNRKR